jgi:rhamnogalacturonan endolyase
MSKWGGTYTVGSSKANEFPMAIFAKTGGTGNVNFDLSSAQATTALTLRVGTTLSFKGGRPQPRIGSWTGPAPKVPKDLNSRGITRGGYRGYGEMYEFSIPAGVLKAGKNTLTLGVAGNGDEGYLSANYIIDAVELVETKLLH